jgi:hypothetical protein
VVWLLDIDTAALETSTADVVATRYPGRCNQNYVVTGHRLGLISSALQQIVGV